MKRRIKDLAYTLKLPKETLIEISKQLILNESRFYNNWDEPKKDEYGNPKIKDGIIQTRPINAPIKQLKTIQKKILDKVLYKINLPDWFYGGIKGKDAVTNARKHQGNKYFFLTDLKDFYPSIHYKRVETALRNQGFYPDVARLITRLCTTSGSIPLGCPTSSYLAALVVYDCAGDLITDWSNQGLKITLYVDDLTISSPTDFKTQTIEMLGKLRNRNLRINFDKTSYKCAPVVITGVVVTNNGIYAQKHTYSRAKDLLLSEASRKGHANRIKYIKCISSKTRKKRLQK